MGKSRRRKPLGKREGKGPIRQRILIAESKCKCGAPGDIARYETIWGITKHVNRCLVCALIVPPHMIVSTEPPEGAELVYVDSLPDDGPADVDLTPDDNCGIKVYW